jgi:hypothetical protein
LAVSYEINIANTAESLINLPVYCV